MRRNKGAIKDDISASLPSADNKGMRSSQRDDFGQAMVGSRETQSKNDSKLRNKSRSRADDTATANSIPFQGLKCQP